MPASRFHLILCVAWACLAGCQPNDPAVVGVTPRGGGSETTLVGRVLDDSGHAVAGASIRVRNEEDSPFDLGIDSANSSQPLAYSDADGKYSIDGVHTGIRYLIECRRDAGRAAAVFADAEDEDTVHAPDAILRPTGVIRGSIKLPDSLDLAAPILSSVYAYIPGLWQESVVTSDSPAFEIRDVPAGTYTLRLQPAFPQMLAEIGVLDSVGIQVQPGETTDVGELTLPLRSSLTAGSSAYVRDSAAVASFGTDSDSRPDVEHHSAVLGNRIISLFDLSNQLSRITDRVRDLDAVQHILLVDFHTQPDSLHPDTGMPKPLSPAISELPHLMSLQLPGMPASGYPRWTGAFPALTHLALLRAGLAAIPEWVLERTRLTYLGLGGNRLETIPDAIAGLRNLSELDLYGNRLQALPAVLLKMKSLQGVYLRYNRICSTTPEERAWIARQDSLWIRKQDRLSFGDDTTLTWESTQACGTP